MRRLPIGIQDFEKLRRGGHIYVDKSESVYKLINEGQGAFFLSRPRRFGKSLLCSTIAAIFEGKRELFQVCEGYDALAINQLDWDWKEHPVILLNLNVGQIYEDIEQLRVSLRNTLKNIAKYYELDIEGVYPFDMFSNLIVDLYRKYNKSVVIIIDEYDKPLLDSIDNPELHSNIRNELKGFYGILKSHDKYLRFTFITGVTKFSKVSLFSDLNHLRDLSLSTDYAEICGLTHEEVETNFTPEIKAIVQETGESYSIYMERLKNYYNGYRFSEKPITIYNPFGLLYHFAEKGKFSPYWYETATPTFLLKLIKQQNLNILEIDKMTIFYDNLQRFDIENMEADVVLYQAGYLTITDYDGKTGEFRLGYPNLEVSSSFAKSLTCEYFETSRDSVNKLYSKLPSSFIKGDIEGVINSMISFLASVPYEIIINSERYYQTFVHLTFSMLGLNTRSEIRIADGRIDTLVETKYYIYCFEFKIDQSADIALAQINSKNYMLSWKDSGKKLFKIGINFDSKKRNIGDWVVDSE